MFVSHAQPEPGSGQVGVAGGELRDIDPVRELRAVSSLRINVEPGSLIAEKRNAVSCCLRLLFASFVRACRSRCVALQLRECASELAAALAVTGGVAPVMDPVTQLKISDMDFVAKWRSRASLADALQDCVCAVCPKRDEHFAVLDRRAKLDDTIARLRLGMSAQNLYLMPEFHARLRVLEKLDYIDRASKNILIKGRVAREVGMRARR